MLIKEYRICMPLSVEEYRVAQLYMIQKKSKEESTGQGSGVEIIKNEPYQEGPGGSGQYTFKIYHIGSHLPGWFRSILPKSALIVEEEAWNAYPYTKTRYKVPIIDKFTLELETYYYNDSGEQNNVFNLNEEDSKVRIVDFLDMVADPISSGDYKKEEDPKIYVSVKTNRGPLSDNWRSEYESAQSEINNEKKIMCAYKLCKVEFKYWGMQTKIEKFIDEIALRKTMLRAHRQAWCWQDEWVDLTMEDIRLLELEAAKQLSEKMRSSENGESTIAPTYVMESNSSKSTQRDFAVNEEYEKECTPIQQNNNKTKGYNERECKRMSFISDDEDDSFFDASNEFQSDTESFMTCKNTFASNMTINMDHDIFNDTNIGANIQKSILVLVVHGGSLLDTNHEYHNKNADVSILRQTFDNIIKSSYPHLRDQIALRLVACPSVVSEIVSNLNRLTPEIIEHQYLPSTSSSQYYVPLAAIPLFLSESPNYENILEIVYNSLNDRYNEFIRSEEGILFKGHVSIISDAIGSLFVYDILAAQKSKRGTLSSESIINENCSDHFPHENHPSPVVVTNDSRLSSKLKLDFKVSEVFMLGAPLGLVLSFRSQSTTNLKYSGMTRDVTSDTIKDMSNNVSTQFPTRPSCRQLYNIFHLNDPSSYRIEPIINKMFNGVPPMKISNHNRSPLGNEESPYLIETLFNNPKVVGASTDLSPIESDHNNALTRFLSCTEVKREINSWWGEKRIDFGVHCPDGVRAFPLGALPHLLHASYWESKDCVAFIIRELTDCSTQQMQDSVTEMNIDVESACEQNSVNKMPILRSKSNSLKFKTMCVPYRLNVTSNHRANDVIVLSGQPQILTARFMYGIFDMLTPKHEKVDIYLMNQPISHGHWEKEGTELTDNNGRVQFHIPESRRMPEGIYPVRMVLKADSSLVQFHLAVLPSNVEAIVFSIDGSFAASMSISGKDPKLRAGGIDVARFWQDKGYMLIYVSARPNMQQKLVQRWLAQHKFPCGMVLFSEGVSTEPLKQKMQILFRLINQVDIKIHCAYGSSKDVSIYRNLGLHTHQIFTLGRLSRREKNNSLPLKNGYAAHLDDLVKKDNPLSRHSRNISSITLNRSCFDIPIKYVPTVQDNSFGYIA